MGFLWKSLCNNGEGITDRGVSGERRYHTSKAESASKQQLKDNETAEDIRKKAMESLKETKKRNSDEGGASPKRCKSRLAEFLREKAAADREIRQQELVVVVVVVVLYLNSVKNLP